MREVFLFRPNDPNELMQVTPRFFVPGTGVERIKGFRYPAPGSQELPSVPVRDSDSLYHSSQFYKNPAYKRPDVSFNII